MYYVSGNCDFDDGTMCTWKNLLTDDFDWLIGSSGTGTTFTGPHADHTQGSSFSRTGVGMYLISPLSPVRLI